MSDKNSSTNVLLSQQEKRPNDQFDGRHPPFFLFLIKVTATPHQNRV